jgi:hypothetical protein
MRHKFMAGNWQELSKQDARGRSDKYWFSVVRTYIYKNHALFMSYLETQIYNLTSRCMG